MKKFLKVTGLIILAIIILIGGFGFYMTRGLEAGKALSIGKINLENVKDGNYNGNYKAGRFSNKVKVTVENKKITKIDIVKTVKFERKEMTQELIKRIIEKQNSDVDIVSSATITSKAYLKSIENALAKWNEKQD